MIEAVEEGEVDGILLDNLMAVHEAAKLETEDLHSIRIIPHSSARGIVVQNMPDEAVLCFSRIAMQDKYNMLDSIMDMTKHRLKVRSSGTLNLHVLHLKTE